MSVCSWHPMDVLIESCMCLRTSVEVLLEHGFKPTRSVILAFGFDEEINGLRVRVPCLVFISCIRTHRS